MVLGKGSKVDVLGQDEVRHILAETFEKYPIQGDRVLVIIPDGTRTAPIPLMFQLLHEALGDRVRRLDYLIALGTHSPMSDEAVARLVGVSREERAVRFPKSDVFNHRWDLAESLAIVGVISSQEMHELTGGLLDDETPVRLNKLIFNYDQIIICGPVFPHEVVGFSGGAKYFFPGIAGAEIIDASHWLGGMVTSMKTIGIKDTPVRKVIHRAAEFVDRPVLCLAMVMKGGGFHGLYTGPHREAFSAAADLSGQLNIITVPHAFKRVLSMPSEHYDDLWTAAKAMYKTEPAIVDGGEVIIYAPHITEVSYTHGKLIDEVGYHVRDYFLKQPERFCRVPGSIKAHSGHVKGSGSYDPTTGVETPRIQVTLATAIPRERCLRINLGYADYREIDPREWEGREDEGILVVPHAGEMLFRAADLQR